MTRGGRRYIASDAEWVPVPGKVKVRSLRQKVSFFLRGGYVMAAYLLARHANKVMVGVLQRTHPHVPWKNLQFAARYA